LTITYFKEDDIIIKRISDDDIVIYEQIMVKSPMSEFAYDKMFYNELYEKETNIASGFTECKREDGKCVIQ
jgi:hypothetical protein